MICTVGPVFSQTNPKHVHVKGYYRKVGTYVRPHYRTAPNSTNRDNFSTRGNVNPYTGKPGWISPDNSHPSISNRQSNARKNQKQYNTDLRSNYNQPKKVGRYPNGYIYATTKINGQLWQNASQINVIRAVPENSFVRILDYENEFWKVTHDGITGYMHTVTMDVNNDMLPLKVQARRRYQPIARSRNSIISAYSTKGQVENYRVCILVNCTTW